MRKVLFIAAASFVLLIGAAPATAEEGQTIGSEPIGLESATQQATTVEQAADGAIVLKGFACAVFNPPTIPSVFFTTNSHVTITPSGNASLVCHFDTPLNPPEAVVITTGLCGIPGAGLTTSFSVVVSSSGQITLVCHLNPSA